MLLSVGSVTNFIGSVYTEAILAEGFAPLSNNTKYEGCYFVAYFLTVSVSARLAHGSLCTAGKGSGIT